MSGLFNVTDGTYFSPSELFSHAGDILGGVEYVFAIIFGIIALIIWRNDNSGYGLSAYLIIVGGFGTAVFSPQLALLFAIILAIGIGSIFYRLYENR